jgi:DNA-binding IclR family transcriptional regulator
MEQIIRRQIFKKKTINTITAPDKLLEEYSRKRGLGYTVSDVENLIGVVGIGTSSKNSRSDVVVSIATIVIKNQVNDKNNERLIAHMVESTREISQYIIKKLVRKYDERRNRGRKVLDQILSDFSS